jgi:hypothetical protein
VCRSWNEAKNLQRVFTVFNETVLVCIRRYSICMIMAILGYCILKLRLWTCRNGYESKVNWCKHTEFEVAVGAWGTEIVYEPVMTHKSHK